MNNAPRTERTSLGPLETAVMETLWSHGGLSPRQAHDHVGKPRNLAYTTILTILQRLQAKGLVQRHEHGRTHRYEALISRAAFDEQQAQQLAESLVRIGDSGVAAFLSEARKRDPSMIEALRKQLEEQA
jgi:BlaI family transcriptional regulator, penicillinase repressor